MTFKKNKLSELWRFNPLNRSLNKRLKLSTTASIAALLTLPAIVHTVQAADSLYNFTLPAGSLSQSLIKLSDRTNTKLLVSSKLISGKKAPALNGNYNLEQALNILLSTTDLEFTLSKENTLITITSKSDNTVATLALTTISSKSRFGDTPAETGGFKAEYQTTATKMAMPLKETPQAISAITRDALNARQVKNLATAVEITPSISAAGFNVWGGVPDMFGGYGHTSSVFAIRGQQADIRVDGFKISNYYSSDDDMDVAAFERVEVVRGPAGFYGTGSIGGFINKVRKKPQADPQASLSLQVGSYNTYRAEGGVTGAINEDESLRARVDFAYEDADAFVDDITSERVFIAPSLEAIISDKTRVLMQLVYQKTEYDANPGVQVGSLNNNNIEVWEQFSSQTALYGATGEKSSNEVQTAAITVNHELSDRWLASLYLQSHKQKDHFVNGNYTSVYNYGYGYYAYNVHLKDFTEAENWAGELRLQGSFDAFGREHQALIGLEANKRNSTRAWGNNYDFDTRVHLEDYNANFANFLVVPADEILTEYENDNTAHNHAIYGQVLLSVADKTKLLLATRYDVAKTDNIASWFESEKTKDSAWTSRIGVIQTFNDNMNAYVTFGQSFTPTGSVGRDGPLDPETGQGYELGLKTEWFNNQLGANLAVYQQELDNRPISDPTNTRDESYSISSGKHLTKGVELDINGSFYPGWTIGGAASWMDNEFTEKDDPYEGLSFRGTFDKQFSLYSSYEIQQGAFQGLGVGATWVYLGDRYYYDTRPTPYEQTYLSGYNRLDLNFSYNAIANWDLNLLVRNVTDETYLTGAFGLNANRGAPRSLLLKATYHFD
jgi:iron complex outermembrane receptor protein